MEQQMTDAMNPELVNRTSHGCTRHRSERLHWRDYDRLPLPAKRAFQNAAVDWCVRCFGYPASLIPAAIVEADASLESPYERDVEPGRVAL